jgi:hypothetical protein
VGIDNSVFRKFNLLAATHQFLNVYEILGFVNVTILALLAMALMLIILLMGMVALRIVAGLKKQRFFMGL